MSNKFAELWFFGVLCVYVAAFAFGFHAIPRAGMAVADRMGANPNSIAFLTGLAAAAAWMGPLLWARRR